MGLNGAVHDAINAADKLAAVWRGDADQNLLDRYERQRLPVQHEYVQQISTRNKKLVEERDPAVRQRSQDELRRTASDPEKAFGFMMDSSMISSIRRADTIR
jgi:3-(3-hydroxy-phenyl)propionate hydroxylase